MGHWQHAHGYSPLEHAQSLLRLPSIRVVSRHRIDSNKELPNSGKTGQKQNRTKRKMCLYLSLHRVRCYSTLPRALTSNHPSLLRTPIRARCSSRSTAVRQPSARCSTALAVPTVCSWCGTCLSLPCLAGSLLHSYFSQTH